MTLSEVVTRADIVFDQAQELFNKGRIQEARALFWDVHILRPAPRTYFGIGLVSGALGRTNEAMKHYRKAVELDWRFWQARINLGILLRDAGSKDEALHHQILACALAPNEAAAMFNLAEVHFVLAIGLPPVHC